MLALASASGGLEGASDHRNPRFKRLSGPVVVDLEPLWVIRSWRAPMPVEPTFPRNADERNVKLLDREK